MKQSSYFFISILILLTAILMLSCENKYPDSLWDPDEQTNPQPIIDEMIPADSTFAGVGQIVIKGQNFSATPDENLVFFSGNRAEVVSSTETEITINSPKITGDTLEVKIAVHKAELFSEPVYYKLIAAVAITGNLATNEEMGYAIAADNDGNVYVSIEGNVVKKIDRDGNTTHFADVTFLKANSMKMGPDNTLYAAFSAGRVKKIATIASDGTEGTYISLSAEPKDFDFDADGNIWVTIGSDVYLVKTDLSTTQVKTFTSPLKTIRVFDGYVYVSGFDDGSGEAKIWRAEIQGETLGTEEVVLDIASADWLTGITVNSFTFSQDGKLFLATDNFDAIFIFNPTDGSYENLFPGLIAANIYAFTWSNDNIIYGIQQLSTASNILKIRMFEDGAPYYGRP